MAQYPIKPPNIGSQYTMFFAEAIDDEEIIDFNTVASKQFFANTTGLSIDITKTEAKYFSNITPVKFNAATIVQGEQNTFATPNSIAYICAKTTNNYITEPLSNGIITLTSVEPFEMELTRSGSVIDNIKFTIQTTTPTIIDIPIVSTNTLSEVVDLINANSPTISARIFVGDGNSIFEISPSTTSVFTFKEKVALIDTHVLTPTEKSKYPTTITIVYPALHGNVPQYFNVLLYNSLDPTMSFQFYGVRNKGFAFNFANNGLTAFTYPQLGRGAVSRPNITTVATPEYIDDFEKIYTQATYNTAPYWDGVYSGQMTDATVNIEFDIPDQLNITGLRVPYPNGECLTSIGGGSILNETAYQQFFQDIVDNKTPSFVLETTQIIKGISYKMMSVNNFINGKASPVTMAPGALSFSFPADAIGQVNNEVELSNMLVFLHDDIPNFVTNI
ncbi:MAG: hypothetical protein ACRC0A_01605 [Chitinophagaceae bacterium]